MKTNKLLFIALFSFLMTSCASTSYFQVYTATPSEQLVLKDNKLVYEDDNCKVSYNLWAEGGNSGFQFFNKTDQNIYLNLEECFFIVNGFSYNYYRNRVFTKLTRPSSFASKREFLKGEALSNSFAGINFLDPLLPNSVTETNTFGMYASPFVVTYLDDKMVCIPSKTSKIVSEYTINESLYRHCDLFKFPKKRQVNTLAFSKTDTPLVFGNRIAYTVGKTDHLMKIENEFYVNEIANFSSNEMTDLGFEEFCGEKGASTLYFKNVSPDQFYIKYPADFWEH